MRARVRACTVRGGLFWLFTVMNLSLRMSTCDKTRSRNLTAAWDCLCTNTNDECEPVNNATHRTAPQHRGVSAARSAWVRRRRMLNDGCAWLVVGRWVRYFVLVSELGVGELEVVAIPPRTRWVQILKADAARPKRVGVEPVATEAGWTAKERS